MTIFTALCNILAVAFEGLDEFSINKFSIVSIYLIAMPSQLAIASKDLFAFREFPGFMLISVSRYKLTLSNDPG
jgi:hypothetical protein